MASPYRDGPLVSASVEPDPFPAPKWTKEIPERFVVRVYTVAVNHSLSDNRKVIDVMFIGEDGAGESRRQFWVHMHLPFTEERLRLIASALQENVRVDLQAL